MSCCGNGRRQWGPAATIRPTPAESPIARRLSVAFEYTGQATLNVVGPVSGRRYRFEGPGDRIVVDPRDRPGLARVPRLREVG